MTGEPAAHVTFWDGRHARWWFWCFAAFAIGVAVHVWTSATPRATPAARVSDPRDLIGALLVYGAVIVMACRIGLSSSRPDPRRRRGAWLVASGAAIAYASLFLTSSTPPVVTSLGVALVAVGLGILAAATIWWNSRRALPAMVAGLSSVSGAAVIYDIAWALTGGEIAPFTPCVGGMDCFAADPTTPAASGGVLFGALLGGVFGSGALLALLGVSAVVRELWPSRRPAVRS